MKTPNEVYKPEIPEKIAKKLAELMNDDTQEWKLIKGKGIFDAHDAVDMYLYKGWVIYAMSKPDNIVLLSRPQVLKKSERCQRE